jgi:HAD superfamily hydrolase (TIGR01509 family)
MNMPPIRAIIFDQDGVIIDTERDGHRIAFNETFKAFGLGFEWSVEEYHQLLQVAGGKERMRHYLHTRSVDLGMTPQEEDDFIKRMHKHKTETFIRLLESGKLPLRPGVKRLMQEINSAGLVLGVCTTSNQRAAHAVTQQMLADIRFDFVLAGDVVSKKKPDPEIYNLALQKTGLAPQECVVIEDSNNGVQAASAAGMHVTATTNYYTEGEDLSLADLVLTNLGDPAGERGVLVAGGELPDYQGVLHLHHIQAYFAS